MTNQLEQLEIQKDELNKIIHTIQLNITKIKMIEDRQERATKHSQAFFNLTRANSSMIDLKAEIKETKKQIQIKQQEQAQKLKAEKVVAMQHRLEEAAQRREQKKALIQAHDEEWGKLTAKEQDLRRSFGKMLKNKFKALTEQYINPL